MRRLVSVAALRATVRGAGVARLSPAVLQRHLLLTLEALLPPQVAAVLEHVPRIRVESPKGALPGFIR